MRQLRTMNVQYSYLAGLFGVKVYAVKQRPRHDEQDSHPLHDYSNTYKVRGNCLEDIPVCIQGFYLPEHLNVRA